MSMMKRLVLMIACLAMIFTATGALAYQFSDNYPLYVVESYSPNGYCYLYDQPSSVKGRNQGRFDNGAFVKVIEYDYKDGFAFVICTNGKTGYMNNQCITPYRDTNARQMYKVYSVEPAGYCYLYDQPSDIKGRNMGRYDNGQFMEVVDWDASEDFARVLTWKDNKYGYVRKACLIPAGEESPFDNVAIVYSTQPKGYCYQYDKPSSVNGKNLGRHNNGEKVYVIDWDAHKDFALVECENGKIGYIKKTSLTR
ncbi:MAG: hypothetical protein E7324_08455 [Clostridiales bacterium]|nr:hypothetical protein [Clostridiales bacterium]